MVNGVVNGWVRGDRGLKIWRGGWVIERVDEWWVNAWLWYLCLILTEHRVGGKGVLSHRPPLSVPIVHP